VVIRDLSLKRCGESERSNMNVVEEHRRVLVVNAHAANLVGMLPSLNVVSF
jgi:hypothetical protein